MHALLRRPRTALLVAFLLAATVACDRGPPPPTPAQIRARVASLLPVALHERHGWAADIQASLSALEIAPTDSNICAVLAVTEQESTYTVDPQVPGLGRIAKDEIVRRAARLKVPAFMVNAALSTRSPDGRPWSERLAQVRTERELNDMFEELIAGVPMGSRLLARANPVRTGGPMQVSIAFAEGHAREHGYPFASDGAIRREVFTRRGGMYFGIAHLLGYPVSYNRKIFRFADFNAGWYASRNAAFQHAVASLTGIALDYDGDLLRHADGAVGATEAALHSLGPRLGMDAAQIRRQLGKARTHGFEDTALYARVYALADAAFGQPLSRARIPRIRLSSPKITRPLTTEWFATRVERRYRNCLSRAARR